MRTGRDIFCSALSKANNVDSSTMRGTRWLLIHAISNISPSSKKCSQLLLMQEAHLKGGLHCLAQDKQHRQSL